MKLNHTYAKIYLQKGRDGVDILFKMGQNIRHFRKLMGLTQEDLGYRMGYTRSSIAKIETGKIDIPNSKLLQFASVLNCTPADLIDYDVDFKLSESEKKLIVEYRSLSDEAKDQVKRLMAYAKAFEEKQ